MRRLFIILLSVLLFSCSRAPVDNQDKTGLTVIALNFPSYDAARAVIGDMGNLRMLLPLGSDSHSFEPTPEDMISLVSADLFIYGGGESDHWVDSLLSSLDCKVETFRLIDHVPVLYEEETDGVLEREENEDDSHHHYDEHVWTSLENEISIISSLSETFSLLDKENAMYYKENAASYIADLENLRAEFSSLFEEVDTPYMLVADRFPILYFAKEFGIGYTSAFPGCAENSEPSLKTVKNLIDEVQSRGLEYIFHMENTNEMLSDVIVEETGVKALEFNSFHNISKREFDSGITYIDIARKNLEVIKEAFGE